MASANTDFNVLNAFEFIDNLNLVVNQQSEFNTPTSLVPSFKELVQDLLNQAPKNFYSEKLSSIVIVNKKYAIINSNYQKGQKFEKGVVFQYVIPYEKINLVILDRTIAEIKLGGKVIPKI
jgi:hypothetical protein